MSTFLMIFIVIALLVVLVVLYGCFGNPPTVWEEEDKNNPPETLDLLGYKDVRDLAKEITISIPSGNQALTRASGSRTQEVVSGDVLDERWTDSALRKLPVHHAVTAVYSMADLPIDVLAEIATPHFDDRKTVFFDRPTKSLEEVLPPFGRAEENFLELPPTSEDTSLPDRASADSDQEWSESPHEYAHLLFPPSMLRGR